MADAVPGWPAEKVELRPLSGLRGYARNSRTHSPEQVAQLVAAIREWGWTIPILVDETGEIIAGHGRVLAARQLGLENVPCMVARGWSEEQKRAYVIADNRLAENAGWDEELLAQEIRAIADGGFDSGLLGFSDDELADLLNVPSAGFTDPDAAPALPVTPISQAGDLWVLGKHRLLCGSSTEPDDVARLLGGVRPHLMVTDPPYGVEYDPAWRKRFGGDGVAEGKVMNDDKADWREAWALFPGDVAYVWHGALHNVAVADSLLASGFELRSQIVWVKTRAPISRGHYHWQHEPAFYAERSGAGPEDGFAVDHDSLAYVVRAGRTAGWRGGRKQTTVWFIEHVKNDTGHGTQKPVECMRRPILNNSSPGQAVYEPFCGSGTTIIAGEMENRPVFGMELDPAYVDVIVRRWQEFVGGEAILEGDGRTFAAVAAERIPAAA